MCRWNITGGSYMKKIVLFFVSILVWMCSYSQDIIIKKNTDEIEAKIIEVGISDVKYKNWNNLDGPVYVIEKVDIFMIKYANGVKESYTDNSAPKNAEVETSATLSYDEDSDASLFQMMIGDNTPTGIYEYYPKAKSLLKINGKVASVGQAKQILGEDDYKKMYSNLSGELACSILGVVALPVLVTGIGLSVHEERMGYYRYYPYLAEGLICMGVGAAVFAICIPTACVLHKQNKKIINKHNSRLSVRTDYQSSMNISLAPNFVGVSLNF